MFSHEDTAAGLSLSCSLAADVKGGASRGVKAACLCTAMVERLGTGATPVPREKLKQVWDMMLEVFGGDDLREKGEELFEEEYVAARGEPMLLIEAPPLVEDAGKGKPSGGSGEVAPHTPRLTKTQQVSPLFVLDDPNLKPRLHARQFAGCVMCA